MQKNRPQLFVAGALILHDNTRPHIVDVVTKKLHYYGWEVLPHAPYSPYTSPPDFELFPKLKEPMRGRRFSSLEEFSDRLFGIVVFTSDCHPRGPGFDSRLYSRNFSGDIGSGTGFTQPREDNWVAT